ncbi:MAG: cupin domain-containing protein, partial [Candidatus Cloacimonetes bacterium]|nr:cupin domain-containing protein [Candidatus Cloacimonadota bacterium]
MIITRKLDETSIMENAHNVDARNLYNSKDAMITVIKLKPGQSLKKHITPVDVAFYVLKGEGIVQIGDEKTTVAANTLVESPKDILHCWYNESAQDLVFMVVKAPRPNKKTVFVA